MEKIIVPVDFSETSASALRFATYLAEMMDVDLMVVHVFDPNFSLTKAISTGAIRAKKEALKHQLEAFVQQHAFPVLATFQGDMSTLPVITTEVMEGFPSEIILQLSDRMDITLMVMGGVGSGKVSMPPDIFGRVARGVALHGQCPVILIPKEYGYPTVEKLALAFKDVEDIHLMQDVVHRILSALRPEVNFIHVESPKDADSPITDEAFLEMALGPDYPDYSFDYASIPAGPVVKRVLEYIVQEKIGMLVLGGKRRSFWEGLFADSSLRPLVNRCEVPLLIIPLMS